MAIKGSDDKRAITATVTITLDGQFLGMQLIYGCKTTQSLPRYEFPSYFSLSVNKNHHINEQESIKFIKEILLPCIKSERKRLDMPDQEAITIFDVFRGQVTRPVLDLLRENKILVKFVPANMTSIF